MSWHDVVVLPGQILLGELSWCSIFNSSHCNSLKRLGTHRFNLWVPAFQISCWDLTTWCHTLTHQGQVTHICGSKLNIISSDNGLLPGRHQAIIWTNAGILLIWPSGTSFSEMLIEIHTFSFKKIHLKMSSAKWWPFCLGLDVLNELHTHDDQTGYLVNTLRPRQNGRHFADDIFKCIFLNENVCIPIKISMNFVPKGPINNITALVQIMAWRRPGDKPLSEPMMVSLTTHICVTRPQWVNSPRNDYHVLCPI